MNVHKLIFFFVEIQANQLIFCSRLRTNAMLRCKLFTTGTTENFREVENNYFLLTGTALPESELISKMVVAISLASVLAELICYVMFFQHLNGHDKAMLKKKAQAAKLAEAAPEFPDLKEVEKPAEPVLKKVEKVGVEVGTSSLPLCIKIRPQKISSFLSRRMWKIY